MAKKNTIPIRVPSKQAEELRRSLKIRLDKKLIKQNEFRMTEGMRLVGRTKGWRLALKDLETKPRKEDLR